MTVTQSIEPASEPSSFLCTCVLRAHILKGDPDVSLGVLPKARTFDKFLPTENSHIAVLGGAHPHASDGTQKGSLDLIHAPQFATPLNPDCWCLLNAGKVSAADLWSDPGHIRGMKAYSY